MKVVVLQEFRDKDKFSKVYPVGTVCEFDDERANRLIGFGIVEPEQKPSEDEPPTDEHPKENDSKVDSPKEESSKEETTKENDSEGETKEKRKSKTEEPK